MKANSRDLESLKSHTWWNERLKLMNTSSNPQEATTKAQLAHHIAHVKYHAKSH